MTSENQVCRGGAARQTSHWPVSTGSLWRRVLLPAALLFLWLVAPRAAYAQEESPSAAPERPNIVLLVADDSGYSDFGPFGGEASTPVIDAFAAEGVKLTNHHTQPTCSPSRSEILTGVKNHINGLGVMQGAVPKNPRAAQYGLPGYTGYLNHHVVTVATLLRDAGYDTYHVGKWHLGAESEIDGQRIYPRGTWPIDQGFAHSFGMLEGGGDHWGACERGSGWCTHFVDNDEIISGYRMPLNYFGARTHTDRAVELIEEGLTAEAGEKPFFLYFAVTLPHEPSQLPEENIRQELIDLYLEKGWDGIRADRLARLKELGIVPASMTLSERYEGVPDWNDESDPAWAPLLEEVTTPPYDAIWQVETVADLKRTLAKKMAVYTGMVEYFDLQAGRIVDTLKASGEYSDTVFIFLSDNGGEHEAVDILESELLVRRGVDNSYENIGQAGSFVSNGLGWAQVANSPLYGAKSTMTEGGIRTPMIVSYVNGGVQAGIQSDSVVSSVDIPATILDFAGVSHPAGVGVAPDWDACTGVYNDRTGICPINGASLRSLLTGETSVAHPNRPQVFELWGRTNKALFLEDESGVWKIRKVANFETLEGINYGVAANEPWKLFHVTTDIGETTDLAAQNPDKVRELVELYNEYEYQVDFAPAGATAIRHAQPGTSFVQSIVVTNTSAGPDTLHFVCRSGWECSVTVEANELVTAPPAEAAAPTEGTAAPAEEATAAATAEGPTATVAVPVAGDTLQVRAQFNVRIDTSSSTPQIIIVPEITVSEAVASEAAAGEAAAGEAAAGEAAAGEAAAGEAAAGEAAAGEAAAGEAAAGEAAAGEAAAGEAAAGEAAAGEAAAASPSSVNLAAGQSATVQVKISVPLNAVAGATNVAQLNLLPANNPHLSQNFTMVASVAR